MRSDWPDSVASTTKRRKAARLGDAWKAELARTRAAAARHSSAEREGLCAFGSDVTRTLTSEENRHRTLKRGVDLIQPMTPTKYQEIRINRSGSVLLRARDGMLRNMQLATRSTARDARSLHASRSPARRNAFDRAAIPACPA